MTAGYVPEPGDKVLAVVAVKGIGDGVVYVRPQDNDAHGVLSLLAADIVGPAAATPDEGDPNRRSLTQLVEQQQEALDETAAALAAAEADRGRFGAWLDEIEQAAGFGPLSAVAGHQRDRGLDGDHETRLRAKRVEKIVATVVEESEWRHHLAGGINDQLAAAEAERDAYAAALLQIHELIENSLASPTWELDAIEDVVRRALSVEATGTEGEGRDA